jgi:hypothetical protein
VCCGGENPFTRSPRRPHYETETSSETYARAELYWDRFISQGVETTSALIEANWITLENVQNVDPSVVQSIPAVTVLTILADSINEEGLEEEELKWMIDGTVCKKKDIPLKDGITSCVWPMAFEVKRMLLANKKEHAEKENIELLKGMLCANNEQDTDELTTFLKANKDLGVKHLDKNKKIRTKINALVLAILRVKPYRDRMSRIHTHGYTVQTEEV